MEDWNQEDQESQEDRQSQDKMDTGPAPPPRIHFGSWAPKAPIREEKQEDQGPCPVELQTGTHHWEDYNLKKHAFSSLIQLLLFQICKYMKSFHLTQRLSVSLTNLF